MFSPVGALLAAVVVYVKYRAASTGAGRRSVFLFALGTLLAGALVGWLGGRIGIELLCSSPSAPGNCALGVLPFFSFLAFTLGVATYLWAKRGKPP